MVENVLPKVRRPIFTINTWRFDLKNILFKFCILFIPLCWPMQTLAAMKQVTGKVTQIQLMSRNYSTYSTTGDAVAMIYMDELPDACGHSGYRRVGITSDHPAFQVVLSAAMAAKISGQTVQMHYIDTCTVWNSNVWDFAILKLI